MGIQEDILERLTEIRDLLAGGAAPAAKGGDKPATKPATKPKKTENDITALIQPYVQNAANKPKIKDVFAAFGIAKISEAKPEQYDALYNALKEVTDEIDNAGSGDDENLLD